MLSGLGQAQCVFRSKDAYDCLGPEGQQASLQFYIIDIAVNLWGRGLLHQFRTFVTIPHVSPNVKNMMLKMGYNPIQHPDAQDSLN